MEQWFSILQRKRLSFVDFSDLPALETAVLTFIDEWNAMARPFNWTRASFRKVLQSSQIKAAA